MPCWIFWRGIWHVGCKETTACVASCRSHCLCIWSHNWSSISLVVSCSVAISYSYNLGWLHFFLCNLWLYLLTFIAASEFSKIKVKKRIAANYDCRTKLSTAHRSLCVVDWCEVSCILQKKVINCFLLHICHKSLMYWHFYWLRYLIQVRHFMYFVCVSFIKIFIYVGETLVSLNWALVNDILLVIVHIMHFS